MTAATVSTIEYQDRTFTVSPTADPAAPFLMTGARGSVLTLVPHCTGRGLFYVRLANGKYHGGFVRQTVDGAWSWERQSNKRAVRANRAAAAARRAAR